MWFTFNYIWCIIELRIKKDIISASHEIDFLIKILNFKL